MMPRKRKTYGLRLRERGGATVRKRWSRIVSAKNAPHKCPSCSSPTVERESVGIWRCTKCDYRFAGGAYLPQTKTGRASMRIRT